MPHLVLLGRFGRAHGVKGEVRLQSFTADPLAVASYGPLSDAGGARSFTLASLRPAGDMLIARVEGVATREAADALNGVELFVPRERLPAAAEEEDEFLLADLIGCRAVLADGTAMGEVIDVANYGAGDLIDIRPAGKPSVLMPFTKAFAPHVDLAARTIVIDPPAGLFED